MNVCSKTDRHNKLQHVLTSFNNVRSDKDSGEGVIPINQDCNIYVSEADPDVQQEFLLSKNRQAYLVCIEGGLSVCESVQLETRDAVEVRNIHPVRQICLQHGCWNRSIVVW